ncbi:uncharacterized protein LOC114298968 [Camellia sinensis]|uniref:uncharacterized protein LOC114298968 n=1 Tax=Camellia sinensis TaxID=4442 RepID=UPI00103594AD|nr:uncharacterized protein LOC114298968 [Camellia sinensis]
MERYYKTKSSVESSSSPIHDNSPKQSHIEINLLDLPEDLGLRPLIKDYHRSNREQVRRVYVLKGPCQPHDHNFPRRKIRQSSRRFNPSWFAEFGSWLEYNIAKDAAFCLCCYLFKPIVEDQGGGKSFVVDGFSSWKKKERLQGHVGDQNENLRAVLSKDVPELLKLTSPSIQKDILNAIVVETTNAIVRELGDGLFSIVFDKSWDALMDEQLIVKNLEIP